MNSNCSSDRVWRPSVVEFPSARVSEEEVVVVVEPSEGVASSDLSSAVNVSVGWNPSNPRILEERSRRRCAEGGTRSSEEEEPDGISSITTAAEEDEDEDEELVG